ncbi:monothiol glutaredoxin-S15, mitochondrial-like isoform X1 [Neltuma alba]|uniref:monothiol glutaredoxin-S15, mitochondrial-like isoform X1 n=1 Tax=Neltuma alba TaxID=207710 RepID=UPI0010A3AC05|nr:monothiol glutaredoxin-S15, mitochondrial-like isoform X1 [Prosopis alba]XP_028776247.1 monothiol glutaredoxin-S15, mitochondrial-like isoform X1 [Prosopis alba]
MVKQITKVLLNSISALPATRFNRVISSSVCHNGLRYSTSVPDGPASHEDLKSVVEKDIKDNSVMIYMKGLPDMPRCGFSSLAVRVLKVYDVPFSARNILENPELKNAVKSVSNWPTFPQIFIKGEFIGGSDIVLNMHQTGELKEKLKDVATKQEES